jgi:hypothetical protein
VPRRSRKNTEIAMTSHEHRTDASRRSFLGTGGALAAAAFAAPIVLT